MLLDTVAEGEAYTFTSTTILGTEEIASGNVEIEIVETSSLSLQKVLDAQILLAYLAIFEKSQSFMSNRLTDSAKQSYLELIDATDNIKTYFTSIQDSCDDLQDQDLYELVVGNDDNIGLLAFNE